ncbi:MAG: hypothetical protein Ta2A_20650 [Treponemataceae bacterium]|nr:MAG: hypothetical protein Ta2A_20650 [Treponemataceae bacterium]
MKKTLTIEELMAEFAEIRKSQRKTDERLRETGAKIAEFVAASKKTDAMIAKLAVKTKKTDAMIAGLAVESKKTDTEIKKVSKLFGKHGKSPELIAEHYFTNALTKKMTFAGMTFDTIARNVNLCRGKLQDEFDIVMYNGSSVALIEAKYKAHENDLTKLVTSKVQNFRILFPHYANYKIYLGLASMAFYDDLIKQAKELGVGILKQHGKTIEFSTETVRAY